MFLVSRVAVSLLHDPPRADEARRPVRTGRAVPRARLRSTSARARTNPLRPRSRRASAPVLVVVKNTRSPAFRSADCTSPPLRYCSATVRGTGDPVLREDVPDQAAAVESAGIGAAVPVRRAPQRQRRPADFVAAGAERRGAGRRDARRWAARPREFRQGWIRERETAAASRRLKRRRSRQLRPPPLEGHAWASSGLSARITQALWSRHSFSTPRTSRSRSSTGRRRSRSGARGRSRLFLCTDREVRSVFVQLQAAVGHPAAALHQDQAQHRLRAVLAGQHLRARRSFAASTAARSFPRSDLTFDHVVPVAQGGRKDWENIVTCCVTCNRRKGGRTPAEARMHLIRVPKRPDKAPAIRITVGLKNAPDSWRDYFYWNMELDES